MATKRVQHAAKSKSFERKSVASLVSEGRVAGRIWPVPELVHVTGQPSDCPTPKETAGPAAPCRKPRHAKDRKADPYNQILDIIRKLPGGADIDVHKPKQSSKVKIANRCCLLPVRHSMIPVMMMFLRRFLNKRSAANKFEGAIQAFLGGLSQTKLESLVLGLSSYSKTAASIRDCVFETRFDNDDNDALLDPQFVFSVWLNEIVQLGRANVTNLENPELVPGLVRPWERHFITDMDQHRPNKVLAPWPWICGINPGADGKTWYKNTEVTRPGSLSLSEFVFEQHEFSQVCTSAPDPANPSNLRFDCHTERIPVPPPGVFAFSRDCHGHSRYNYQAADGTLCLKIPEIIPGNGVMLAGLNFFSRNAKVHLRRLDGSFPNIVLDCGVNGDRTTPLVDKGIVVANCQRVTDLVTFTIPEKVGAGINARPLPPGRYSITVVVPNDVGYAPVAGTVPSEFVSNDVWIEILPNPTQTYRLWTDEAFCYEETDGPGSDEPWFQAYIAQFIPGGSSLVTMFPQRQVTIMRTVDVDSGEPITFSAPDLFRGRFQPGEIFAATIVGLEVDSEDAADQQIKAFGDAYALYWEHFITQLAVQSDVSIVLQLITKGVATGTSLALGAGILGGIAVVGILYALWAGADPIGYDMMALNGMVSFDLTNPTIPLPATSEKSFGSLSLSVQPESKKPQAGGTHAKYSESHIYRSEDEDSTYKLVYRVERV